MARPREFDMDTALDRAMGVFWMKGYEAASLEDLLKAMKIARGSLYKAFDDKRNIYLAALDRYDKTEVEEGIEALCDPKGPDGLVRIREMLDDVKNDTARRGCFMCNAAIDQARFDRKVEAKVTSMLRRLEDAIGVALKQSKKAGRWSAKRRTETARAILNTYMGLRVLSRSGYPPADLQAVIDASLRDL